jgi:hypothetical protein
MEGRRERNVVEQIIQHACVSGACRRMARQEPEAARGLIKCADFHHEKVAALSETLLAGLALAASPRQR